MGAIERRKLLAQLQKLCKDLSTYKKRQQKHISVKFTEGQIKKLGELRIRVRRNYEELKDYISAYGGAATIKIATINYDVFNYSLRRLSLNELTPQLFSALDKALGIANKTIEEITAIPGASIELPDIQSAEPKKESAKTQPISITLQLHPKVLEVSQSLFESGHYSQAIFEALKAVNNLVKERTGLSLDGKDLMSKAFREENPIIKLNELNTQSDKDEQEGFKFLYMGAIVGIRNPKAHETIIQTDPYKTLEYLAFASLLMRRVEESTLVT